MASRIFCPYEYVESRAAMNRFSYENADWLLHISQESTFGELW